MAVINYIHVLFTGPLLLYLGIAETKPGWVYIFVAIYALLVALLMLVNILSGPWKPIKVWYMIHLIIFVPLLLLLAAKRDKTPRIVLSILLALGFAAVGYHSYKIFRSFYVQNKR